MTHIDESWRDAIRNGDCTPTDGRTLLQKVEELESELAVVNDDRLRAFSIGYQWTNECQTVEEMTASLAALIQRVGKSARPEALPQAALPYPDHAMTPELDVDARFAEMERSYRGIGIGTWACARWYARSLVNEIARLRHAMNPSGK